jgi:7-cyano-7-deazaguanine reductase
LPGADFDYGVPSLLVLVTKDEAGLQGYGDQDDQNDAHGLHGKGRGVFRRALEVLVPGVTVAPLVEKPRQVVFTAMPDASLLEVFPSPVKSPFLVEHINEEFTSVCPKTGHPDFGTVTVRFEPAATCVELKSLKLYCQSFRNEGIFYEAVTNQIRDDLVAVMSPRWLQVVTDWRGRGGIRTRITACHGEVPHYPVSQ